MTALILSVLMPAGVPADAVEYRSARYTQAIYRLSSHGGPFLPRIDPVPIAKIDPKWHRSGGLSAHTKFVSRKFRSGGKPAYSVGGIQVKNSSNYFQTERGLLRTYPPGARFDDVLSNEHGTVFEHRVREKSEDGKWRSRVIFRDAAAFPKGYAGLGESCASCHSQSGSGGYGVGLVPGGDTVLSDPLDWSVLDPKWSNLEK